MNSNRLCEAIAILQEKWVLHIVRILLSGPTGFNELGRAVGGCNPSTLAQRLQRLEHAGLVCKCPDGRYELTASGLALRPVMAALDGWAEGHLAARAGD